MNKRGSVEEGQVEKTIGSVIHMMERLNAVIAKENGALRDLDRKQFLDLQMEKATLAKSYELEAQKLIALRGKIGRVDDVLKQELKGTHKSFSESTNENLKVLKQRGDSVRRLNARIVDAARQILVAEDEKYDASGQVGKKRSNQSVTSGLHDTV